MKKLFEVNTKKVSYYENKMDAKTERKILNGIDKDGNEMLGTGYRVSRGTDHWRNN